jgi:hypothetical protein
MIKYGLMLICHMFTFKNLVFSISCFDKMRFKHRGEDG